VAHTDGTLTGFPAHGAALDDDFSLFSLDGSFTQPTSAPAPGKLGILAARYLLTADLAAAGTVDVPLDAAAFIPAITDQSWTGNLYLSVWLSRHASSGATVSVTFDDPGAQYSSTLRLPAETLSRSNRDTGRPTPWGKAESPLQRCPVTGLAILGERMVPDGYREGLLVHPLAYDPPEPDPRPDYAESPWDAQ
jgi:hypothetical protein